ncbi:MAG: ABC transporter substrate-binding protein, partial [Pseudomonadota bacterium]
MPLRSFTAAGAVAVVGLAMTAALPSNAQTEVTWATEGTYAPWSETDPNGALVGFDIELVELVCAHLGYTCTIERMTWPAMMHAVADGEVDAFISGIAITAEREVLVDFTRPYMQLAVSFAVGAGSDLADGNPSTVDEVAAQLDGATIGVQGSTVNGILAAGLIPGASLVDFDSTDALTVAVANGDVDAGLAAAPSWTWSTVVAPEQLVLFGPQLTSDDYSVLGRGLGIGVNEDADTLKIALDDALCDLEDAGAIQ